MKKTITLAVLALGLIASASAVTLDDAVLTKTEGFTSQTTTNAPANTTFSTGQNGEIHAFTMTIVLDWQAIKSNVTNADKAVELFSSGNQNSNKLGLGLEKYGDNWLVKAYNINSGSQGVFTLGSATSTSDWVIDGKVTLTLTQTAEKVMVHALTQGADGSYTLTSKAPTNNNTAWTPQYVASGNLMDRMWEGTYASTLDAVYVFNETYTDTEILSISQAAHQAAVPEPATATLSLLALAGLAARRRRK